jgi:hypothetical protein
MVRENIALGAGLPQGTGGGRREEISISKESDASMSRGTIDDETEPLLL